MTHDLNPARNRMEQRHDIHPMYPAVGILEICQYVHSASVGASDPIPEEDKIRLTHFLKICIGTWDACRYRFDAAALELARCALEELQYGPQARNPGSAEKWEDGVD